MVACNSGGDLSCASLFVRLLSTVPVDLDEDDLLLLDDFFFFLALRLAAIFSSRSVMFE